MKNTDKAIYSREEALEILTTIGTEPLDTGRSFGTTHDINVPSRKDRNKTLPFFTGDRVEDRTSLQCCYSRTSFSFCK